MQIDASDAIRKLDREQEILERQIARYRKKQNREVGRSIENFIDAGVHLASADNNLNGRIDDGDFYKTRRGRRRNSDAEREIKRAGKDAGRGVRHVARANGNSPLRLVKRLQNSYAAEQEIRDYLAQSYEEGEIVPGARSAVAGY